MTKETSRTRARVPRFRLDRELGRGTSGRVWHGVLTEPFGAFPAGFEVAVKYLHPELERDEIARDAFEREAEVGMALASSVEGLVCVLASGIDSTGRFLVMSYVPGATLREVRERGGGFLPEPLVRMVGRQVASGLALLHGAGYSHGDVKPDNIRLDAEGHAVLLDLGFVQPLGADRHGDVSRPGSLPYVAPEQARGEAARAASDVFALGVVLYEAATGAHPFTTVEPESGSSGLVARAALDQHGGDRLLASIATARFVAPSRLAPGISPFLDRLMYEVLQRDPLRRPAASELLERLVDQEAGAWWRATLDFEASARRGGTGEADAQHLTPFIGHEAELERLLDRFAEAARDTDPAGSFAWLEGPAGSGKSRLVNELAARARTSAAPPLFLYGRSREFEEERPCRPFLRMLERWLRLPPGTRAGPREVLELESLVPPRVAQALALALDRSYAGELPVALPVALSTWLLNLGKRAPLLVFLDDVQWSGPDTWNVVIATLEAWRGTRGLFVLARRDEAPVRANAMLELARTRLAAQARFEPVRLAALDEESVQKLVTLLFHHSAPRLRLARVLWQRSRGNPGLLTEILRGLRARDEARPHPRGGGLELVISPDALPLPRSLRKAIVESYKELPADDRAWLRRLAVVGGRIETDFLVAAFDDSKRAEVDAMLARLCRSGWLTPTGARYRFTRPALREAVYRGMTREQRMRLHAGAADALRASEGKAGSIEDDFQRAFHLRAAERREDLLTLAQSLVRRLLSAGQPQRVHPLALWGLEAIDALPPSHEHDRFRIDLLEAAADASDRLGQREDQRSVLDRLSDLEFDPEVDPESVGRIYVLHGRYAVSTGQYGLARGMLRNAVEMFRRGNDDTGLSEALRRLSAVQSHVGELDEATKLSQEALERAQSDTQRALARLSLGVIDVLCDRIEGALEHVEAALSILRANPSREFPGIHAHANLLRARVYRSAGDPRRALASAKRAAELARVAGERRLEAEALARLGGLLLDTDRAEEAEARLRDALLLAEEIEDRRGQALARTFLGILLWENADPDALRMLLRAGEIAREMGLNRVQALTAAIHARILREEHGVDDALVSSQFAVELLDRYGAELGDRIVIAGTRVLVLRTAGRVVEAERLERELRARIERDTAQLRSPLMRLRRGRAEQRLLEAVLSPIGPVYPRIRLDDADPTPARSS